MRGKLWGRSARLSVFNIDAGFVFRFFQPHFPFLLRFRRKFAGFGGEPIFDSKSSGAFTGEQHMGRRLHQTTCDRDRVFYILHKRNRSTVGLFIHDRRVERHKAIPVRQRSETDAATHLILSRDRRRFNGIDGEPALRENFPRGGIGAQAAVPGGDDNWFRENFFSTLLSQYLG